MMKKILAYIFVLVALPGVLVVSLSLSIYHTMMLVLRETPEQLYMLIMYEDEE
jgi:membrane-bound metal-dependent hydrolase YbcI (DUF457 family)